MKDSDKLKVAKLNNTITKEVRSLLDRYGSRCSKLTVSDDPHTPVIAWVQMALATSAVEYLIAQGCTMNDAININLQTIEIAMNHWLGGLQQRSEANTPTIETPEDKANA